MNHNIKFLDWLSGLIDGVGCFILSKKGYGSLEITMDVRDAYCLSRIKTHYGGAIKLRVGNHSIRYRLHHKDGLLRLLNDVNGRLRNSNRLLQFSKLCANYAIIMLDIIPLLYNSNWMAGFFDTDGTIIINGATNQLVISISQKTQELLVPLQFLYKGNIYIDRSSNTFKWYLTKKEDILKIIDNYIKNNYIYSEKRKRLFLVKKFYELKELKKQDNFLFDKCWNSFIIKWNNFE